MVHKCLNGRAPDYLSQKLHVDKLITTEIHDTKKT